MHLFVTTEPERTERHVMLRNAFPKAAFPCRRELREAAAVSRVSCERKFAQSLPCSAGQREGDGGDRRAPFPQGYVPKRNVQ